MNTTKLPAHLPFSLVFLLALAAALHPVPARAQECGAGWTEPVVGEVELAFFRPGDRRGERFDGGTLRLATRTEVELEAVAVDQQGRRFPDDRFVYSVVPSRYCEDLVSVEDRADGGVRLETGSATGDCELLFRVANNLNFDRRIRVVVARASRDGYARSEAEVLATWLYRAVLGREPEPSGLQSAIAEIQKGQLGALVRSFVASPEFQNRRRGLSAAALLESFYQGLLDRAPDTAGLRSYLGDVERGRYDDVLWALLHSDELEARLDEELR
ncbi:MAG TPA: DUF4214 domain-containing protein [Thermoanaerobaculia bacterium]|nr:DUF4214 domain-containing protein [Thermoanaerobaculia bacterium]